MRSWLWALATLYTAVVLPFLVSPTVEALMLIPPGNGSAAGLGLP